MDDSGLASLSNVIAQSAIVPFLMFAMSGVISAPVAAQFEELSCELVSSDSLDSAREEITEYAQKWLGVLASDDADLEARVEARNMLVEPLTCRDVSVAFRIEYGRALRDRLERLVRGDEERLAFEACQIAGRIASNETTRALLDGLRADAPSVRCGAAAGLGEVFRSVATGNLAVGNSTVNRMLNGLADAMESEADPLVVENMIVAFQQTSPDPEMFVNAMEKMSEAMYDQAMRVRPDASRPEGWDRAIFTAVHGAYTSMLDARRRGASPSEFPAIAGRLSGQAFIFAQERMHELGADALADTDAGETLRELVNAADSLLQLSHGWLQQSDDVARAIGAWDDAVDAGEPSAFDEALESIIGSNGRIFRAPYSADRADFRRAG